MQANCCVFPAPKQYEFSNIIKKIVLIPKNNVNFTMPQYYMHKYLFKTLENSNQFINHIRSRKNNYLGTYQNKSMYNSTVETIQQNSDKKFEVYTNLIQKAQKNRQYNMKNTQFTLQQKYNQKNIQKVKDQIPCLFLPSTRREKIMVFFHGNGEDISSSYEFASFINEELQVSVLLIEYQGYSIYDGEASPLNIVADSKIVIDYLLQCGYTVNDIILFGRSIGGAIAFQAASHYQTSSLILLSPFLSLKKVAQDLYGKCASSLLKQTLDNATIALTVKCPILIIHGLKDNLVPYHHSISILKQCKGFSRLKLVQNMTHIKFNFRSDFIVPVKKFLYDLGILGKNMQISIRI